MQVHSGKMLSATNLNYPYIMVRQAENSYRRHSIHFIRKDDKEFLSPQSSSLVIGVEDDFIHDDEFEVSRELIIDAARAHMYDVQQPVCVVFNEDDYVFFDHLGSACEDAEPPFAHTRLEF